MNEPSQPQDPAALAWRARGELAAAAAHELNQPLAAITNLAQLIRLQLGSQPGPELAESLETLEAAARRAAELMGDLASLRPASQAGLYSLALGRWLRGALVAERRRLRDAQVELELEVPEALPPARAEGLTFQVALGRALEELVDELERAPAGERGLKVVCDCIEAPAEPGGLLLTVDLVAVRAGQSLAERRLELPVWFAEE